MKELNIPFNESDIEWRIQQCGEKNGNPWAMVLTYVTNRAIMDRLDESVGPHNWKNDYKELSGGALLCGISIKCQDEWVTKWDGADKTEIEAVKGGISGAMKRAAVQWGIGRYLYDLPVQFANISDNGEHYQRAKSGNNPAFKWNSPSMPEWATPNGWKDICSAIDFYKKEENSQAVAIFSEMLKGMHSEKYKSYMDRYKKTLTEKVFDGEKKLDKELSK